MTLEWWHSLAEIVVAVATTLGIGVAGVWTYLLFVRNRGHVPKARILHRVTRLRGDDGTEALLIEIDVANIGECLLRVCELECRVEVIRASDKVSTYEIGFHDWRYARGEAEVEPGEVSTFDFACVIAVPDRWMQVRTFLVNEGKRPREIGWQRITPIDRASTAPAATTEAD